MRTAKKTVPTLDLFRLAAVLLVVMNHTSPLADVSAMADFWLTRVLARVAVPFFLMTTGYFLSRNHWAGVGRQLKKLCLLYGVCILLYLPVNLYAGSFTGPADVLRKLLVDGTFYHLWYFPATILGIVIARWLSRLGLRVALPVAALLYLIGLGGDSYYGLVSQIPLLRTLYDGIFTLCGYTRNGLFFAPLFLLLGAAGRRWNQKLSLAGFFLSLAAMSAEGLWLHRMDVQRHDSMYLALPLCIVCLFSLLLGGNKGESRKVREFSTAMYVLHPLCIVLVRGAAKLLGLGEMLIENSVLHFIVVLALSVLLSAPCLLRLQKKPSPTARAWREVDLAALGHNAQVLRNTLAPGTELMAVVKAEAYGHGGAVTARTLQRAGVRAFAVACLAEGIALRKAGIRGTILILGYTSPEEAPLLTRWHLTQTVADIDHGRALAARGRRVHVHLALDTGMHRLGILAENREKRTIDIGVPVGIVAGLVPSTNPTSTVIYKSMICMKAGNPIIFSPHPSAVNCILETVNVVRRAAEGAGAPAGSISCITTPTLEATNALMRHDDTRLILATGGGAMVKAAYSSGTPAIGVGAGNGPAYIHHTADVRLAVKRILDSKTFDNGTICASEQSIICDDDMVPLSKVLESRMRFTARGRSQVFSR